MSSDSPSLSAAYYKVSAAKLNDIKTWASNNGAGGDYSNWEAKHSFIGDPYPNQGGGCLGNGGGWGSCTNCGAYALGGSCGCGANTPWIPNAGPYVPNAWPWPAGGGIGISTTPFNVALITKTKEKADILGDFFGPDVHALVILDEADGGARFVPFMDKLNMIWLQETLNSWAAYDRDEFLTFVNSDQTAFLGTKLNKAEVLKRMMKPDQAPENLNEPKH